MAEFTLCPMTGNKAAVFQLVWVPDDVCTKFGCSATGRSKTQSSPSRVGSVRLDVLSADQCFLWYPSPGSYLCRIGDGILATGFWE